jgi:hypothetical protein
MKNNKLVLVAAFAVVSSSQNLAAQTAQLFSDVKLRSTSVTALDSARVQVASYHAPTANADGGDIALTVDAEDATVFGADRGSRTLFGSVDLRGTTSGAVALTVTARNVLFGATDASRVAVASVVSGQDSRFIDEIDQDADAASAATSMTGSYEGAVALADIEAVADGGSVIQLGGMDLLGSFGGRVQEVIDVRNSELIATNESSVRVGGVSIKGSFATTQVSQTTIVNNLLAVADNRASVTVGGAHLGRR